MCAGDFELILQGASTLWPDRKSQKISEHRIRFKWIKCSTRTKTNPVKIGRATTFGQEEAQTSPTPSSWGQLEPWAGRPTWSMGPTALVLPHGASSLAPKVGSARKSFIPGVAPSYKYKGRG